MESLELQDLVRTQTNDSTPIFEEDGFDLRHSTIAVYAEDKVDLKHIKRAVRDHWPEDKHHRILGSNTPDDLFREDELPIWIDINALDHPPKMSWSHKDDPYVSDERRRVSTFEFLHGADRGLLFAEANGVPDGIRPQNRVSVAFEQYQRRGRGQGKGIVLAAEDSGVVHVQLPADWGEEMLEEAIREEAGIQYVDKYIVISEETL